MLRLTCDGCGKELFEGESRYEVQINANPCYDQDADLFEELDFHGEESLTEMMERLDREARMDCAGGNFHLDLCEDCYCQFVSNPLMVKARDRVAASPNTRFRAS